MDRCAELFPFVEHLESKRTSEKLFLDLIRIHADSKWNKLKSVCSPRRDIDIPIYVTCLLKFRKTMTHVVLADKVNAWTDRGDDHVEIGRCAYQYDRLAKRLTQFPQLTHLYVFKCSNRKLENFDSLIESCKYLTSLELAIYQDKEKDTSSDSDDGQNEYDLSLVVPRPLIKHVEICAVIDSDNALQYIMLKFPNPETFILNKDEVGYMTDGKFHQTYVSWFFYPYSECTAKYSVSMLLKFISYVAETTTYHVARIYLDIPTISDLLLSYWGLSPDELQSLILRYEYKIDRIVPGYKALIGFTNEESNLMETSITYNFELGETASGNILPPQLDIIKRCGHFLDRLKQTYQTRGG